MLISMKLEELELVVTALDLFLDKPKERWDGYAVAAKLSERLAQQAKQQRRMLEPVKVALTLNGCEYAATLNPESDEVEVRIAGIPSMSGEWRKPWVCDSDDPHGEDPEKCIVRRDEYDGMTQPDDDLLEVLSVALRHALAYR
jgi:hypothetical protein